jgi:hypothetical protein
MPVSTPDREPPFLPFFLAAAAAIEDDPDDNISLVRSRYVASEQTAKRTPLPTIRPLLSTNPLPGNAFTDTLLSNVFLQKFITEYVNYKYFSYATYIQTKSNQYDNAVKEAYGYSIQ